MDSTGALALAGSPPFSPFVGEFTAVRTAFQASMAYVEALTAPSKQVVWFDESGHEPFMDEAEKFNATLRELVRPVVVA